LLVTREELQRLVRAAVLNVPGVLRMAPVPRLHPGFPGLAGIVLHQERQELQIDCFLHATADRSLVEIGLAVQATAAEAVRTIAGLDVRAVNVFIEDVHEQPVSG
jgi:uncharacterized alkaline shock family protein YloU